MFFCKFSAVWEWVKSSQQFLNIYLRKAVPRLKASKACAQPGEASVLGFYAQVFYVGLSAHRTTV